MEMIQISFTNEDGFEQTLKFEKDCTRITISDIRIVRLDLSNIADFRELEAIEFDSLKYLKELDLTPISMCKKLRAIEIKRAWALSSLDMSALRSCPHLEIFKIVDCGLGGEPDFSPLAECQHLREFILDNTPFSVYDLGFLENCPELEKFWISTNKNPETLDLSFLLYTPNLREFFLGGFTEIEIDIEPLSTCKKLESFTLINFWQLNALESEFLQNFPELKKLVISGSDHIQCIDFSSVEFWRTLQELNISLCRELREIVFPSSGFPELRLVIINHNMELRRLDLFHFQNSTNLDTIEMKGNVSIIQYDATPLFHLTPNHILVSLSASTLLCKKGVKHAFPHWFEHIGEFDSPTHFYNEKTVRLVLDSVKQYEHSLWKIPFLVHGVILSSDIPEIGLLDIDMETLRKILEIPKPERKQFIISLYSEQIERGGTTVLADISGLRKSEFAFLIDDILELRKAEIQNISVPRITHDSFDLRNLFLTAYGFKIGIACGLELECTQSDLEIIKKTLMDIEGNLSDQIEYSYDPAKSEKEPYYVELVISDKTSPIASGLIIEPVELDKIDEMQTCDSPFSNSLRTYIFQLVKDPFLRIAVTRVLSQS